MCFNRLDSDPFHQRMFKRCWSLLDYGPLGKPAEHLQLNSGAFSIQNMEKVERIVVLCLLIETFFGLSDEIRVNIQFSKRECDNRSC